MLALAPATALLASGSRRTKQQAGPARTPPSEHQFPRQLAARAASGVRIPLLRERVSPPFTFCPAAIRRHSRPPSCDAVLGLGPTPRRRRVFAVQLSQFFPLTPQRRGGTALRAWPGCARPVHLPLCPCPAPILQSHIRHSPHAAARPAAVERRSAICRQVLSISDRTYLFFRCERRPKAGVSRKNGVLSG